ncbi:UDP-N-acetylglucosamine 2-epimerase (non-hydrolyzing) [Halobacteriovorax marinus]|uniref:non-hydrolyzing UDP-N-acetylglucosamine 2-epimerase n=1 Tax=Halobacteriovorax marinus TaxID=97084 RepID=UPI000BC2DB81|nr:UDP-N-acetylglucosamine 2-epimerase (non-hydrolyzing) [Halobacteriovorax marinus]ATH06718.1 UDP-N-acetylglucosamine 2-epimerase (non-hydrolyzing) [Halobacteriovorax marinus]
MDSKKFKLVTVVGTRPEIIRLSEVIKKCDVAFNHILAHTGQNWNKELSDCFFSDLSLRQPDYFLEVVGEDLGETMGNIISKSYKMLVEEKPDAILVLGDTNSCLSVLAAKRLKIPIFHMEAGNRCFDLNVPEEINRRIVDHVSDINLPYTEHSRRYLLDEGIRKEHVFVTGSPMAEVINVNKDLIDSSEILSELGLVEKEYILVSAHREENVDIESNFLSLIDSLNIIAEKYRFPIIFSTHPRTQKRIDQSGVALHPNIQLLKPFGFFDYNKLQMRSFCVLSDSGTLSEESALLRFPGILIRTSTERPEVLDKGSILVGGIDAETIISCIDLVTRDFGALLQDAGLPNDYLDLNVSNKIVKIISSYISIVNRNVWRKS